MSTTRTALVSPAIQKTGPGLRVAYLERKYIYTQPYLKAQPGSTPSFLSMMARGQKPVNAA
jgi:hypothetical protein